MGGNIMSAFSLRKNNVGRAVVRFLIGAVIIAAIVIALNELVLKKKDNTLPDLSPQPSSVLIADQGHTDEPTVDSEPADDPADVQTGENAVVSGDETDDPGTEPDGSEDGTGEIDETGDPGVFGEVTEEPTAEPTPDPTPDPTPTPLPTPTPVPSELYAKRVTSNTVLKTYKWKLDKESRVKHGITELEILTSVSGGSVISFTGWSYGNWEGFNGRENTTYVYITNEKGERQLYEVTVARGATGITHKLTHGHNMDYADFTCVIDVSAYPSGTYSMGTMNRFKVSGNSYSFGYGLGDAYTFTVVDGIVTAMGGVEN